MLNQLESQEIEFNLKPSLALAMERVGMELSNINSTIFDIETEFSFLSLEKIQYAIRCGGLGKYGRTYKMTTQEVCYWIREYIKSKDSNRLKI